MTIKTNDLYPFSLPDAIKFIGQLNNRQTMVSAHDPGGFAVRCRFETSASGF